jgi:hypothetical protein
MTLHLGTGVGVLPYTLVDDRERAHVLDSMLRELVDEKLGEIRRTGIFETWAGEEQKVILKLQKGRETCPHMKSNKANNHHVISVI